MAKPGCIVEVVWLDHALHLDQPHDAGLIERNSVGWLIAKDRHTVTIAHTKDFQGYHDHLVLGRSLVTSIKVLR